MSTSQLNTLSEIVASLGGVDTYELSGQEPTIYAAYPWNATSRAAVEWSLPRGGLPEIASQQGLVRLVEVRLAKQYFGSRLSLAASSQASADMLAVELIGFVQDLAARKDPYGFKIGTEGAAK